MKTRVESGVRQPHVDNHEVIQRLNAVSFQPRRNVEPIKDLDLPTSEVPRQLGGRVGVALEGELAADHHGRVTWHDG